MKPLVAVLLLALCGLPAQAWSPAPRLVTARTVTGATVRPLDPGSHKAVVLLFIAHDCPISNQYAPEMRRLAEAYAPRGVAFYTVYAEPGLSAAAARQHTAAYGFPGTALLDPRERLAVVAGATATPEAAVFTADGRRAYLGRVDDRYAGYLQRRELVTSHDLRDALDAVLAGRPVPHPTTVAVGCFLAPLPRSAHP